MAKDSQYRSLLVSSGEAKRLFINKCKKLGITPYEVVKHFGKNTHSFRVRYEESKDPALSDEINDGILMKYLKFVGIKVNILIVDKGETEEVEDNVQVILEERRLRNLEKD